jgi:suppressor for copper-sensitivity B
MTMRRLFAIPLLAFFFCLSVLTGVSAQGEWKKNDQGQVRLIAASSAIGEGGWTRLGLHFQMNKGWKIYWRSPGDAGFPPKLDWAGSANLGESRLLWPAPLRFAVLGLQTVGYKDEVVLPVLVRPERADQPMSLRLAVDYLVCDVVCVPQNLSFSLDLPAGAAKPTPESHLIDRFMTRVPGDGRSHGLSLLDVKLSGHGRLSVTALADPPFSEPDLFIEGPEGTAFDAPQVHLEDGGKKAILETAVLGRPEGGLPGKELTLTLVDGGRGLEAKVTPEIGQASQPRPAWADATLPAILLLALLGGLILNLMPCVLPVLSLKVLGLIGHGGAERKAARASFIASALGIMASFLLLAAAAIAVKAAGMAVGWGIQFQQPVFLAALALLVTLFAVNLWGVFEIPLPGDLGEIASGGHEKPHSLGGHFATGMFATLLATPCSAPFLGTAIGFALARGPADILAVFAALGLGMALPYLAIALWPGLATRLPRPGPWMITLKRFLGLALAGTAVWLLTVLVATMGIDGAMAAGLLLLFVVLGLVLRQNAKPAARQAIGLLVAALALFAVLSPLHFMAGAGSASSKMDALWKPFDLAQIPKLVAEGKTVFVDVTADWCITCQVNKAAVLTRGEAAKRLSSPGDVAMRADWTRPNDAIAAYLASFGRYGIPFNAVYGPGAPEGITLPELLSEAEVLAALDKASGGR